MMLHRRISPRIVLKRLISVYAVLILIAASFVGGLFFGRAEKSILGRVPENEARVVNKDVKPAATLPAELDFNLFWQVWDKLKSDYVVQPVPESKLFYGAIQGMVASLDDPYSAFFEPTLAEEFSRELAGKFEGIGAEVGIKNGSLIIVAPLPDTPAERGGLLSGDKVLAINGENTLGMPLDIAVSKIRGPRGTVVTLKIMRGSFKEPKDFAITRDEIVVSSVRFKMMGNIAEITITQFNEETVKKFNRAVKDALANDAEGIILDLRNNPGGYLDAAVQVAGDWASNEVIVTERLSDDRETPYRSDGKARLATKPTVVLVNQGSASGSEIVAGALQDHGKATVIGKKTFGKGSVQSYEQFSDGSALKLTVAEWLTPKRRSINRQGVEPDIELDLTDEDYEADRDPQMDKAFEILKEKIGK